MPSATEIITRSLRIAGIVGQSETPTAQEMDDGLVTLNDLLDSWSTDRTYIFTIYNQTFPLVDNQTTYTIGTLGDFNMPRPEKIDNLVVNLDDIAYPLNEIDAADYSTIAQKTAQTGIPEYFYYDSAFPLGNIYFYGAPSAGLTVSIGIWQPLQQFADLTTNYEFPPGYNRLLNYGLAMELAPEYGLQLSPQAIKIMSDAMANVRNKNLPEPVMKTEVAYLSDVYGNTDYNRGY